MFVHIRDDSYPFAILTDFPHLFFNHEAILSISNNGLLFRFRPLLKQIKNSAESHIVLDCSTERIYDVLKQAQQIGMMSDYHSYLITSLVSIRD